MPYMVIAVFIISALLSLLHGPFALPGYIICWDNNTYGRRLSSIDFFQKIISNAEQPRPILLHPPGHLICADPLYLSHFAAYRGYAAGVVALSPVGLRSHVGTIGFGEKPVNGSGGAGRRAFFV